MAVAVAACFGGTAIAQPAGLIVRHGSATMQQHGGRTTITTGNGAGSRHSALDWRSFQVPGGKSVFFAQPDALSTSINRVTGGSPSAILGTLGSNGRLVLVNPAGIAVGPGAVVDTAGFTASTLAMSTRDAVAGRMRFGGADTDGGAVQVQGRVLARSGDVVLLAPKVETGAQALVQAANGDVVLAAGRQVEITGRGIEGIHLHVRAPQDRAVNLGKLAGDSVAMFAAQLRHSGLVEATGSTVAGGRVVLQGGASAEIDGAIRAATPSQGGSVHLSAERLVLKSTAAVDVRHARGGGEILAGGGWQGADARISNARGVEVEQGAQLRADATLAGNGGTVVVWSDDTTRFHGALSARGAGVLGNGGRAEVSGRRQLVFRGTADLGASRGAVGTLLLDPETVTIRGGSSAGAGGSDSIYESEIEGANANVTIQATRQIRVGGSFGDGELTLANNRDLRLEVKGKEAGGIDLRGMPVRVQGSGEVRLVTDGKGQDILTDRITTAGGKITLEPKKAAAYVTGQLSADGAEVKVKGDLAYFSGFHDFTGEKVKLEVDAVRNDGTWHLGGGRLDLKDANLTNGAGGIIEGSGTLALKKGTLFNQGVVRPGGAGVVGELVVDGKVVLESGSVLQMEVAGRAVYDTLRSTDTTTLGGQLEVAALAYTPQGGDSYALVRVDGKPAPKPKGKGKGKGDDDQRNLWGGFTSWNAPAFGSFAPEYSAAEARFVHGAAAPQGDGSSAPPPATVPSPAPAPATEPGAEPAPAPLPPPPAASPTPGAAPAPAPGSAPAPAPGSAPGSAPAPAPAPGSAPAPAPGAAPAPAPQQQPRPRAAQSSVDRVDAEVVASLQQPAFVEEEEEKPGRPARKRVAITAAQCVVAR